MTEHEYTEFVYLAVIHDAFSRKIVGWELDRTLATRLPMAALEKAIEGRRPPPGLVHHSDRGVQGVINRSSQHLEMDLVRRLVLVLAFAHCEFPSGDGHPVVILVGQTQAGVAGAADGLGGFRAVIQRNLLSRSGGTEGCTPDELF